MSRAPLLPAPNPPPFFFSDIKIGRTQEGIKQPEDVVTNDQCLRLLMEDNIAHQLCIAIYHLGLQRDSIVTIRADFQQGMESVSFFKMNTVTENYWLIYAAATIIWCVVLFSITELI